MRIHLNSFLLLVMSLCFANCGMNKKAESDMNGKTIMEVTTFNINSNTNPMTFAQRDVEVESDFYGSTNFKGIHAGDESIFYGNGTL